MSERREEQRDRGRGRGPLVAVLVVTIIALIGVIGVLSARALFGEDEEPQQDPTTSAEATPTTPKPLVREDLDIVVGEGGSDVSQFDPSVPIGYEPTCKGAVQAATNYLVGLDYTKATSGELSQEEYVELTRELTAGDHQESAVRTTQEMFDQLGDAQSPRGSIRPGWGGFNVAECSKGESATVLIVHAYDYTGTGKFYYATSSTTLAWADGDWKITGTGQAESPATLPEDPVTEPDQEVLTLVGTHTQWENYENAS